MSDAQGPTPAHYNKRIGGVLIDPYRIFQLYGITNPCQQHAIKKLLRAGTGHRKLLADIQGAEAALVRWREMLAEEEAIQMAQKAREMLSYAEGVTERLGVARGERQEAERIDHIRRQMQEAPLDEGRHLSGVSASNPYLEGLEERLQRMDGRIEHMWRLLQTALAVRGAGQADGISPDGRDC